MRLRGENYDTFADYRNLKSFTNRLPKKLREKGKSAEDVSVELLEMPISERKLDT